MKMKNSLWLLLLLCTACQQKDIMLFDREEAGVYFQAGFRPSNYVSTEKYSDSTDYSFSVLPDSVKSVVLSTTICTMGKTKDYPRPVKLTVDRENSTAVQGIHFDVDTAGAVIPAGESRIIFPVTFFRTKDLINGSFQLVLRLQDNEHFKVYFNEQKSTNIYTSSAGNIRADAYKFVISEVYTEPYEWWYTEAYFGRWSVTKFLFINKTLNISVVDWENAGASDSKMIMGRYPIYAYALRAALQELADAGTPVMDEDGDYMQLGRGYEVDYSAYK